MKIAFTQNEPQTLEYVQHLLETYQSILPQQEAHYLAYEEEEAETLLGMLGQHVVSRRRAEQINGYLTASEAPNRVRVSSPTLPWAAGFLDACGSLNFTERGVEVGWTCAELDTLRALRRAVGGELNQKQLLLREPEVASFLLSYSELGSSIRHLDKLVAYYKGVG